MAASALDREWDVFVSYARENARWVTDNLYEPLRACRTAAGARPVVFMDVAKEGIPSAANFLSFISEAIQRSRYIVAVYSHDYFNKPMCEYELTLALGLHVDRKAELHPVLLETSARDHVPFKVKQINWYPVDWPDWFQRLCDDLQLTIERTSPALVLRGDIGEITVNHTLPAVEVEIVDQQTRDVVESNDRLTIRAAGGELRGTVSVQAQHGVAVFGDLSFSAAADAVKLVVEAPACLPAESASFAVRPEVPVSGRHSPDRVDASGLPFFFPDSRTLAVLGEAGLRVFTASGALAAEVPFPGRLRLWSRGDADLAFADWSGVVTVLSPDGRARSFDLSGSDERALSVPGALAWTGDRVHVGMWNGAVWELSLDSEPRRQFDHAPGVQALGVTDERWLVAGLDGRLCACRPGEAARELAELEPLIVAARTWPGCTIAVGERQVHRVPLAGRVLHLQLPVGAIAAACLDGQLAVAVNAEGSGVRFDSQLNIQGGFYTAAGARPLGVDRAGDVVVFAYPDGSHVLMVRDRVIFSSSTGPFAVAPDGSLLALNDGSAIRMMALADLAGTPSAGGRTGG